MEYTSTSLKNDFIFFKNGREWIRFYYRTICYFESKGAFSLIYLNDNSSFLISESFKDLEIRLPSFFFRVHRKYIVNLNEVIKVSHEGLHLNNYVITIGNSRRGELMFVLGIPDKGVYRFITDYS